MHELHMTEHIMFAIESGIADGAVPFGLPIMNGAFVG